MSTETVGAHDLTDVGQVYDESFTGAYCRATATGQAQGTPTAQFSAAARGRVIRQMHLPALRSFAAANHSLWRLPGWPESAPLSLG